MMKLVSLSLVAVSLLALSSSVGLAIAGKKSGDQVGQVESSARAAKADLAKAKNRKIDLMALAKNVSEQDVMASQTDILMTLASTLQFLSKSKADYGVTTTKLAPSKMIKLDKFSNTNIWETKALAAKAASGVSMIKIGFDGRYDSFGGFNEFIKDLGSLPVVVESFSVAGGLFQSTLTIYGK